MVELEIKVLELRHRAIDVAALAALTDEGEVRGNAGAFFNVSTVPTGGPGPIDRTWKVCLSTSIVIVPDDGGSLPFVPR